MQDSGRDDESLPHDRTGILQKGRSLPCGFPDQYGIGQFVTITDKEIIVKHKIKIPKTMSPKRTEFVMNWMKLKDDVQRDMYRDALPKQYQMPKVFFIFRISTKCHALSDLADPPAIFPLCSERIQSGRTDSQGCVVTHSLFITVVPSHFCGTL